MSLETIGWIGGALFAFCAVPQAWKSYKDGNAYSVSWGFLNMWLLGEICTLIYVFPKGHMPLLFNYVANIAFIFVILYYKAFPREVGDNELKNVYRIRKKK